MPRPSFRWNRFEELRVKPTRLRERVKRSEVLSLRHAHHFVVKRWKNTQFIRQHMAFWLIGMGLLIAGVALQFGWYRQSYTTTASVAGGTYVEGVLGNIKTLNPLYAQSPIEKSVAQLVFSTLFTYDETGGLKDDLANDISTQDKGKTYVVTMRRDALWHDGKPITAADIVYTLDLIKNPEVRSSLYAGWSDVDVKQLDTYKLQFTLKSVYAPFPNALTFPVLPKHILSKVDPAKIRESIDGTDVVGSGPYSIVTSQAIEDSKAAQRVVRLERSKNYYRGLPNLERIQLYAYPNQDALLKGLDEGDVNAASGLSMSRVKSIGDQGYRISATSLASGVYALLNNSTDILKDRGVRHALQIGTDVQAIVDSFSTHPERLDTPFTGQQVDTSSVNMPSYDAVAAGKSLDSAGWKLGVDGFRYKDKKPLRLNVVTVKSPDYQQVTDILEQQWRKLGVQVNIRTVDVDDPSTNIASSVLQPRNYDVLVYELFLGADPDVYAYWSSSQTQASGLNLSNFSDPISDDILIGARSRTEPKLRTAKYLSFTKQWIEKAPAIGLYQSQFVYAARPNVQSIKEDSHFITPTDRYADINYWTVRLDSVYKTP